MDFRNRIKKYNRIVVKVGTTSLTHSNGKLNIKAIEQLSFVLSDIRSQGKEVVLVSSGAIAVGTERLSLESRPRDIIGKQVASAVGQCVLMQIYESFFSKYNQEVAQVLLTKDVFNNSITYKNAKNTLTKLLEMGVIPIVNENDAISTDELEVFSDNDSLSAYVCNIIEGDILILLSDIDGMYTKDPNKYDDATIISTVLNVNEKIEKSAEDSNSLLGTGGMKTKVQSAKMLNKCGVDMIIASGNDMTILFKIINGEDVGTLFVGNRDKE